MYVMVKSVSGGEYDIPNSTHVHKVESHGGVTRITNNIYFKDFILANHLAELSTLDKSGVIITIPSNEERILAKEFGYDILYVATIYDGYIE